ncbi:ATP synthase F1 subunit delta [Cellulophaga sp. 20_2_10]|uniref:ATP synthase F1 subunit delta n=1 Tax=Cellulophaga sp. 20_2_10 TaxID=2942476 RepID=UPI00201AF634|nr:ATP synthase F1 subunit delta [Cellulophaga sp. 20_2_10]MCL5247532.1 ATP synthase F1 subunit delta [Cellulophaga sp. 20_2_10]
MNESRAAIRYAKAILSQSVEAKVTEAVEKDMHSVVETISDSKELQGLLGSPIVKGELKKKALLAVFAETNAVSQGLISLLVDNKRVALLKEVAQHYIVLNKEIKGEESAVVTTAVPLTAELEARVLEQLIKLTGKKVAITNVVDESIIGGFVLRIGDLQYNASVANKLSSLKREFSNSL